MSYLPHMSDLPYYVPVWVGIGRFTLICPICLFCPVCPIPPILSVLSGLLFGGEFSTGFVHIVGKVVDCPLSKCYQNSLAFCS